MEARQAQARRDQEMVSLRIHSAKKSTFNKKAWESTKRARPAETPTAAKIWGDKHGGQESIREPKRQSDGQIRRWQKKRVGGESDERGVW